MMEGSLLDLVFESGPYEDALDKKAEKNNKQFSSGFVKEVEEGSKSDKQWKRVVVGACNLWRVAKPSEDKMKRTRRQKIEWGKNSM